MEGERFYRSAFGLRAGRRLGNHVLELLGWPVPIYLLEKAPGTDGAAGHRRSYERHWTPVHVDVVVPDLNLALRVACEAGATMESGPADLAFGRIATFADPFGNGFCLIEFSSLGYDAVA